MTAYDEFIGAKLVKTPPTGIVGDINLPTGLLPIQDALAIWALRRGRCAVFADTGLGKSRTEIAWASVVSRHTGAPTLILTPLAVAAQMVREGEAIGVPVTLCRDRADLSHGVNVINYDRLHRLDTAVFGGVACDESSIIKHHDAKTLRMLIDAFGHTPFRLCATATPAPNDWTELGTHAEFLGICTRPEMLAEYFVHDGGDTQTWRLKGHARTEFWRWVASWAALVRKPSDLGFDDTAYALPPLHVHQHIAPADHTMAAEAGMLFALEANTLSERRNARRASMGQRVADCVAQVNAEPDEPWLVWCDLNAEQDALSAAFGDRCFSVYGSMSPDDKETAITGWLNQERPIMVSKSSIMGWGINAQHCARSAFVGVTDSWEGYYQAVRRCWRFGQRREVHVHIFSSELEGAVVANLRRKEADAATMAESLSAETKDAVREAVTGTTRIVNPYNATSRVLAPSWLISEAA